MNSLRIADLSPRDCGLRISFPEDIGPDNPQSAIPWGQVRNPQWRQRSGTATSMSRQRAASARKPGRAILAAAAAVLSLALAAQGQQRAPRIGYVYPAGGRQGSAFRVTIGGQFLDGASTVIVSGDGVQATVIEHAKPLGGAEFQLLRDKLKDLMEKKLSANGSVVADRVLERLRAGKGASDAKASSSRDKAPATNKPADAPAPQADKAARPGQASPAPAARPQAVAAAPTTKPTWTDADERMLAEVRKKLMNGPNRQGNPAITETVFVEVKIAPDAAPGRRELRLTTALGLTNPMVFCVGKLPEFSESSPPSTGQVNFLGPRAAAQDAAGDAEITLPAVANGQIMPGDADRFRFKASKGLRLVVAAQARELIPYLADAVPGWLEARLALYDSQGNELASADRYRFHPDPVLCYEIPADDVYIVEIRDSIYRGRQDFVYRITIGELPLVTSIFPLGHKAGERTAVELTGWNLPEARLTADDKDRLPGVYPLSVGQGPSASNRVPFAVDSLPECLEQTGNDMPKTAQKLTPPIIVNGRIDKPGDCDVFGFAAKAGSEIVAEVFARRLDSPLDSVLKLTDSSGKQLACNDDNQDKGAGLETHHADSFIRAKLPADGTYYIHLGDIQKKGGREYAYRLRVSEPRPDFELRVVPSSLNMRAGASTPITVHALRKDGFDGEITLAIKGSQGAFTLSGGWIPAGQDHVRLTLTAPRAATTHPISLALEGKATIAGRDVVRQAAPAEDMMQAFIYRHLVVAQDLKVSVTGGFAARAPVTLASATPVKIPAGGTARVQFTVSGQPRGAKGPLRNALVGELQLELSDPPDGITLQQSSLAGDDPAIILKSDAAKAKPGLRGNLIVNVFMERSFPAAKDSKKTAKRRVLVATLPAMPFEVVAGKENGGTGEKKTAEPVKKQTAEPVKKSGTR